jgi:hypothetical protein
VNVTLPAGSEEIIGLPWYARKTDVSANAAGLLCAGSDTFADTTTSLTTTTQGAEVGAVWDGTYWRPLASSGGAVSVAAVTTTGAITAGTTMAAGTGATIGGAGAGTADATLVFNKTTGGVGGVTGKVANTRRVELILDASENLILRNYAADGTTVLGSITFDNASGLLTSLLGLVITAGGLTVTAGGISLVAGNLALTAGVRAVLNVPEAADDAAAAALSPTVPVGGQYHTAGAVKTRLA